jgi:MFS family permease
MHKNNVRLLFSNRSFLSYLIVRVASSLAIQMVAVAVGWQIYELTKSTWYLGLVGLVQFVPVVLLTLLVGYIADNFNRKAVIALCGAVGAGVLVMLALGSMHGWITTGLILLTVFLIGAVNAFDGPTMQSMLPNIVDKELFPQATALTSSGFQAATIIGPALGGVLYVFSPAFVYGIAAGCMIASIVFIIPVSCTRVVSEREPVSFRSLFAGISFIKRKPIILGAISLDLFAVLFGGATALLPVYASTILNAGPVGLGLLRAAPAVGALVMTFFLVRKPMERHVGRNMFIAVIIFGLSTIIFAISKSVWLSIISLFVLGAADMISVVVRGTLVQMGTPDAMRGRVSSVNFVFIGSSNQLGEFESGVTATLLGPVAAAVIGGVATIIVVGLWIKMFPKLAKIDRFPGQEETDATLQAGESS